MLQTFLFTFALFAIAVLVMTAGVLLSGRSLKGSCGGPSCTCAKEGLDIASCENGSPALRHPPDSSL